jgi:DNA repair protein SbcD/Mre11
MDLLIIGDLHLGKSVALGKAGIGANLNSRISDQLKILEWLLDVAINCNITDMVLTGDIFDDPKPHPAIITLFIAWLKKCECHKINIHIIMGNHDIFRSGFIYNSPLDIISELDIDGINVYKDISTIFIAGTAITLVPFKDRKSFQCNSNADAIDVLKQSFVYELASIPATYKKIMIGHLAIEGSIPIGDEIDDVTNELFCPLDAFNGYDYVWMGHVHKPQIMLKTPHIAHIGSMDISNFGETDHKKHIVLFDCNKGEFFTKIIPTRNMKKISMSVPPNIDNTTEYIIDQLKSEKDLLNAIVKVEISLPLQDSKSVNKKTVEKYLLDSGVFNIANISESKKVTLIKSSNDKSISTSTDVTTAIKSFADLNIDPILKSSFIELAMEIYNTYKENNEIN